MRSQRHFAPFVLLAAGLYLLASLALVPWPNGLVRAEGVTTASEPADQSTAKHPHQVLIIRHAEKPDEEGDPHLTSRGAARAAALPALFLIPPTFPTKPAPFPAPDFVFATKASKESNRPIETVTPLAKVLGDLHIHDKHANDDFQALVDDLFGDAKYAGKTVLVCWHHGKIPKLAEAVLARAKNADRVVDKVPKKWDELVFDQVWQITFDDPGEATFAIRFQQLLFKDKAE
jgi:hypothetical protein